MRALLSARDAAPMQGRRGPHESFGKGAEPPEGARQESRGGGQPQYHGAGGREEGGRPAVAPEEAQASQAVRRGRQGDEVGAAKTTAGGSVGGQRYASRPDQKRHGEPESGAADAESFRWRQDASDSEHSCCGSPFAGRSADSSKTCTVCTRNGDVQPNRDEPKASPRVVNSFECCDDAEASRSSPRLVKWRRETQPSGDAPLQKPPSTEYCFSRSPFASRR